MQVLRKLVEADKDMAQEFLQQNIYATVFMVGDMLMFGIDGSDTDFWGLFEGNTIKACLMRFRAFWHVFEEEPVDLSPFCEVMRQDGRIDAVNGVERYVNRLMDCCSFEIKKDRVECYMNLPHPMIPLENYPVIGPKRATGADVDKIAAFYADEQLGRMQRSGKFVQTAIEKTRLWYILEGLEVVSVAYTHVEAGGLGMIGGVVTLPQSRNKGYSTRVMQALCLDLQTDDIEPVLFWDDPAAGHVYDKVGFKQIGTWRSVTISNKTS